MKFFAATILSLLALTSAWSQNEQSPMVEKEINYKNWTYKSVLSGQDASLRDLVAGKKLTIVVYYAPWCPNWRHDAPILQKFYEKYRSAGLEIIGVGEYDPVESMKTNLDTLKVTFPVYYESVSRDDKQKTTHYEYRKSTGDGRNWGSPWYIFIEPAAIEKKGETLIKKTHVINGEIIEIEGDKFIREKLGLPAIEPRTTTAENDVEVCDPSIANKTIGEVKKS